MASNYIKEMYKHFNDMRNKKNCLYPQENYHDNGTFTNIHHLQMCFLLKMVIFQCHVNFEGCTSINVSLPLTTFSALNFKVMTKGVMARHTGEMVPSQWTGALGTTVSRLGEEQNFFGSFIGVSSNGGTPISHPKMTIFSRKTHGCWVPAF